MEGQKISEKLKNTALGVKRFARTMEYLPEDINKQIEDIVQMCNGVEKIFEDIQKQRETEREKGYRAGFEEGRKDACNQFQTLLFELNKIISGIKESENEQINNYFKKFVSGLGKIIPQKNISFFENYIKELINKLNDETVRIIVSEKTYSELNGKISLPKNIELCSDENLNFDQLFIERDGILCDAGLDRFFERIEID